MYARLWWKDARMFWPIWVALVVVAAGVQWLLLHLDVDGARSGLLIVLGLDWSLLYAFAVGAAAFAGERETNTQVFLDTLPVGRRMLWTGKVSFAMVTTLVLALALAALGALGTPNLDSKHYPIGEIVRGYGSALFEGVAWSLLWSVVLASALQAAALGLLTVGLLMMLLSQDVNFWDHSLLAQTSTLRLAIAGGAFLFSWIAFTLKPLPDSSPARDAEDSPPDPSRGPVIAQRAPFGMTSSPFGRLVWQTVRESCGTWLMLAAMAFFTPGLTRYGSRPDSGLCAIFGILAALVAGVSVFGPVNRTRSYRFLAHHGVRPGVIWAARVASWGLVMSIILVAAMFAFALAVSPRGGGTDSIGVDVVAFLMVEAFVVALLCGQVVRRGLTAWVVACLAFVLLALLQAGMAQAMLIPIGGLAIFPTLVIAISWAWTRDWMEDLRGPSRWLRLGAMVGGAATLMVSWYIGYRAWGVPDIGPPFTLDKALLANQTAPPAPDRDAAPDYTRIIASSRWALMSTTDLQAKEIHRVIVGSGLPGNSAILSWLSENHRWIEPLRRAAEKPELGFSHPELMHSPTDRRYQELGSLILLLGLDSAERRSRGDLDEAWKDLRAVFGITAQMGRSGGAFLETSLAVQHRTEALEWALVWAADPRQTPATLRAALASFRTLPELAPIDDSLRAEFALIERTIRRSERDPGMSLSLHVSQDMSPSLRTLVLILTEPSWERERARRVRNVMFTLLRQMARFEPWQRIAAERESRRKVGRNLSGLADLRVTSGRTDRTIPGSAIAWYKESTPLARQSPWWWGMLLVGSRDDLTLLGRAFEQVVALRIWQLEHYGRYPDTLAALVPGLLPRLPLDPYSGKPFLYRPSQGQRLMQIGRTGLTRRAAGNTPYTGPTRPGQWLLYSVGPNQIDDGARTNYETNPTVGDLIFPLPWTISIDGP